MRAWNVGTMGSRFAVVVFAMMLLSSSGLAQHNESAPPIVSMVQLLSNPNKYDGKPVVVFGFLTIGQENNNLYLGKADYDNVLLANSIWVDLSTEMLKNKTELEMKYVRIVGVFRLGPTFHKNSSAVGGISQISECRFWSDPAYPLSEKIQHLISQEPTNSATTSSSP